MRIRDRIKNGYKNIKIKAHEATEWCKENPEKVAFIAVIGLKSYKTISRNRLANKKLKIEEDKLLYIWDAKAGYRWKLRRPLTNDEALYIRRCTANGDELGDILFKMNLLDH